MTLEEEKVNQNEGVRGLLKEDHKAELGEILAFGEKYKAEGEKMRDDFWNKELGIRISSKWMVDRFRGLILQYEESKKKFEEGLLSEEKKILEGFNEIEKNKFYEEYLLDRIVYSGDVEREYDNKVITDFEYDKSLKKLINDLDRLGPGVCINLGISKIGEQGTKMLIKELKDKFKLGMGIVLPQGEILDLGELAREWKNNLKLGMRIFLWDNIGDEGVKILVDEWKNSLQPGMAVDLGQNDIGPKGAMAMAKGWKNSLQPGMLIALQKNHIGDRGAEALAKEWKDKLQPGIDIHLFCNEIGDEGADAIMKNLKMKEGVVINLGGNDISNKKKEELKEWAQGYKNRGINCEVIVD